MTPFATIKDGNGQLHLTAPVRTLLLRRLAQQQHNEVNKDVQLFLAHLNNEGFVSNLHGGFLSPPFAPALGGDCVKRNHALMRAIRARHNSAISEASQETSVPPAYQGVA
jgi:hypothetical protein